jgi:micrococcal nuclease
MRSHLIALAAGFLGCGQPRLAEHPPGLMCQVERISDGDSFYCQGGKRVRLIGIDTPELDQGELGRASRESLRRMMPVGSHVRLETDVRPDDQYGRTLAYVWRDSVMINRKMIREGWAVLFTVPPNIRHVDQLQAAQDSAQVERSGHWGTNGFSCQPSQRRRGEC